jgi:hypothetical protein
METQQQPPMYRPLNPLSPTMQPLNPLSPTLRPFNPLSPTTRQTTRALQEIQFQRALTTPTTQLRPADITGLVNLSLLSFVWTAACITILSDPSTLDRIRPLKIERGSVSVSDRDRKVYQSIYFRHSLEHFYNPDKWINVRTRTYYVTAFDNN